MKVALRDAQFIDLNSSLSRLRFSGVDVALKTLPTEGTLPDINVILAPGADWSCGSQTVEVELKYICGGDDVTQCKVQVVCDRPQVMLAGYLSTDLAVGEERTLEFFAVVTSPTGVPLRAGSVALGGVEVFPLPGLSGPNVFSTSFQVLPTGIVGPTEVLLEFQAGDWNGSPSYRWPYLNVGF